MPTVIVVTEHGATIYLDFSSYRWMIWEWKRGALFSVRCGKLTTWPVIAVGEPLVFKDADGWTVKTERISYAGTITEEEDR